LSPDRHVASGGELTVDVLYVRAVVALVLPVLADVVVPAVLLSFAEDVSPSGPPASSECR
jgi:hypothetical protein